MAKKPGQPSKRKASKAKKQVPQKASVEVTEPTFARLPSVFRLLKQTLTTIGRAWGLFAAITALYAVVYIALVKGLSTNVDVAALRDQFSDKLSGSLATSVSLLGGNNASGSQGFQIIVLLVFSLALIWALRQVLSGTQVRLRDSLYQGMYPLVPFMLVALLALVELLPLVIGLSVYQLVIVTGVATTVLERIIWGIGMLGLVLLSLYLIASTIFALYIVTLPDMTPVKALRSANRLVRKRRGTVMRKVLPMPILLAILCIMAVLPVVLVAPPAAPWVLVPLTACALTFAHAYMYTLYRELLNE